MNIKLFVCCGILINTLSMFGMDDENFSESLRTQHFSDSETDYSNDADQNKNIIKLLAKISDKLDIFQKETANNFKTLNNKIEANAKRLNTMEEKLDELKTFNFQNGTHLKNLLVTIKGNVSDNKTNNKNSVCKIKQIKE